MLKPLLSLFKYTWHYSKGNRVNVVLFIVMSLIANMVQLAEPVVISRALNSLQTTPNDASLLRHVISNLSLLVVITLVFWLFHGISRNIEQRNAFWVRKNFKLDMFNKVLALPIAWHKDHHSGDTIDKINKASEGLFEFSRLIFVWTTNFVRLFGGAIALWFFDKSASVIALCISVLVLFLVAKFDSALRTGYYKIFKAENSLASAIHDYVSNIITIITLRLKSRVFNEIEDRSMQAFKPFARNNILGETKWFTASLLLSLMITSVLMLHSYTSFTATGVILVGTLFALYQYLRRMGDAFFDFALRYGEMVRNEASVRAAELINDEYKHLVHKENSYLPQNWNEIKIKNLNFTYEKDKKIQHIKNVNLSIGKSQRIAFIGESGSGKSTLLALMRGLYSAQTQVYCDGIKLPAGLEHLHEHVTLIPQDPEIFNSTVEDNITMDTHFAPADLDEAIDLAQFRSVLHRLPKGLKTNVLEKGVSLSGGEKQRLALARGILAARSSGFLFMDEPTSSVDTANELKIYQNIFVKFSEKTIISAIHRLHLLKFFDYIYFFKSGKIIGEGDFNQLLKNSEFKQLWENYIKTSADE